jgi:LPS-assembly lipoprotein
MSSSEPLADRRAPARPRHGVQRRRLVALGLAGTAVLLAGCGFQRRQTPPLRFRSIALLGFAPRSPMRAELAAQLAPQVRLIDEPSLAQLRLQALEDVVERSVVAITAAAQVRELQLRVRLVFSVSDAAGRELIPRTELMLTRDLSTSETLALAKEREEAELLQALRADIAAQVLRRLAALAI